MASKHSNYFAELSTDDQQWHRDSKFAGVIYAGRDYYNIRQHSGQVICIDTRRRYVNQQPSEDGGHLYEVQTLRQ